MKVIKPPKKSSRSTNTPIIRDPKKELLIKELTQKLAVVGYSVRREKLRQGPGWRAVSGSCLVRGSRTIFLDSKLPQDEQIVFLGGLVRELSGGEPISTPTPVVTGE